MVMELLIPHNSCVGVNKYVPIFNYLIPISVSYR